MAVNYIPVGGADKGKVVGLEKHLLLKHYDFLQVKTQNGVLTCFGYFQPSEYSVKYEYKVKYDPAKFPKVYVTKPAIKYHKDIHLYKEDNRLCLYYPSDFSWTERSHLFDTIIPWTHEWFVFYELYQITGTWHHPFVDHNNI